RPVSRLHACRPRASCDPGRSPAPRRGIGTPGAGAHRARGASAKRVKFVRGSAATGLSTQYPVRTRGPDPVTQQGCPIQMTPEKVLQRIREEEIRFVDLRFSDTLGKEQHITLPAHAVDEDMFEDGTMFDGSSIVGWKGVNESDMVLMPDAETACLDPFSEYPTLSLTCDILEPDTMQGYSRCPRSLARRAEAFLQSSGLADAAFFGPEPEFFVFDDVRWNNDISGCSFAIDSEEAAWNRDKQYEDGNYGHRPRVKGGYFPVPPVDGLADL